MPLTKNLVTNKKHWGGPRGAGIKGPSVTRLTHPGGNSRASTTYPNHLRSSWKLHRVASTPSLMVLYPSQWDLTIDQLAEEFIRQHVEKFKEFRSLRWQQSHLGDGIPPRWQNCQRGDLEEYGDEYVLCMDFSKSKKTHLKCHKKSRDDTWATWTP